MGRVTAAGDKTRMDLVLALLQTGVARKCELRAPCTESHRRLPRFRRRGVRRLKRYESSLHDNDRRAECHYGDHHHSDNDDHGAKAPTGSDSAPG